MNPQGNGSGCHFSYKMPAFRYSKWNLCDLLSSQMIIKNKDFKAVGDYITDSRLTLFGFALCQILLFKASTFPIFFQVDSTDLIVLSV